MIAMTPPSVRLSLTGRNTSRRGASGLEEAIVYIEIAARHASPAVLVNKAAENIALLELK